MQPSAKLSFPNRKSLRLAGYDYSTAGAYFITICVANRRKLLWDIEANWFRSDEALPLSATGKMAEQEIEKINMIYENVSVDQYCIMPDHLHMIVIIVGDELGRTQLVPSLSRIVKQFKGVITKQLGQSIWQKSFNDRIIRTEQDYYSFCQYMADNPKKYLLRS